MQKTLYSNIKRDSFYGDESEFFTLHFDESKGFYVVREWEKDYVSGGNVKTREDESEMSIQAFLKSGPPKGVERLREMIDKMFS